MHALLQFLALLRQPFNAAGFLIRTGAATLVTSGAEVLEVMGAAGEHLLPVPRGRDRPRDALTERQRLVLDAVPVARAATSSSIARLVGVSPDRAHATLLELEVRAMVECGEDGWRLAPLAHD